VIVDPLSAGADQSMTTFVPLFVVVGALGTSGIIALRFEKSDDAEP
jgi:hypothetical protein